MKVRGDVRLVKDFEGAMDEVGVWGAKFEEGYENSVGAPGEGEYVDALM